MRIDAESAASQEKRTALSRTANRRFNSAGMHKCKMDLWHGCWYELKDWQKVEEHQGELREGKVPVHCGYEEVAHA